MFVGMPGFQRLQDMYICDDLYVPIIRETQSEEKITAAFAVKHYD